MGFRLRFSQQNQSTEELNQLINPLTCKHHRLPQRGGADCSGRWWPLPGAKRQTSQVKTQLETSWTLCDTYSDSYRIYSDIYSDIYSHIYSDIYSDIYSHI